MKIGIIHRTGDETSAIAPRTGPKDGIIHRTGHERKIIPAAEKPAGRPETKK